MKSSLIAIALTLTLTFPTASADSQVTSDTTARTGDYLDLATNLVYHYDEFTGALTTTSATPTTNPAGFSRFDIWTNGEVSTEFPERQCTGTFADFCLGVDSKTVGQNRIRVVVNGGLGCFLDMTASGPSIAGVVTNVQTAGAFNCGTHGSAWADFYVNGVRVKRDTLSW